jgi:phenylalanyl-tRNA synthetase beta subunit
MGLLVESQACVFELDLDYLLAYKAPVTKCKELAKYQGSFFDVSCGVPVTVTASSIKKTLALLAPTIEEVALLDFFEKEEWIDTRSLTFRVAVRRNDTTITKEEVDVLREKAIASLGSLGVTLRA